MAPDAHASERRRGMKHGLKDGRHPSPGSTEEGWSEGLRRSDVLVQSEEVVRIVGALEGSEPLVCISVVSILDSIGFLVSEIVAIDRISRERLHGSPG